MKIQYGNLKQIFPRENWVVVNKYLAVKSAYNWKSTTELEKDTVDRQMVGNSRIIIDKLMTIGKHCVKEATSKEK